MGSPRPISGPKLDNFAGDVVTAQQVGTIFIDAGRDSIFTCTDSRLDMLDLAVTSAFDARDTLGIDTSGNVSLIGGYAANSKVLVNGTEIGTLQTATNSIVHIQFNDNATGALVQELIHALTYTRNVGSTNGALTVDLHILDDLAFQAAGIITIDPPPTFHVLTAGNDAIAGGGYQDIFQTTAANLNAGDELDGAGGTNDTVELIGGGTFDFSTLAKFDKIEAILGSGADNVIVLRALQIGSDIADIDGGGGNDTLQLVASGFNYDLRQLTKFIGVETILGSAVDDTIWIKSEQLADVKRIGGNGGAHDKIDLDGGAIVDLSGIDIQGFDTINMTVDNTRITLDDIDTARHVHGEGAANDTLILTQGILNAAERLALHRQGVDTIINNGATTTHHAPALGNIDGDQVTYAAGDPIRLIPALP